MDEPIDQAVEQSMPMVDKIAAKFGFPAANQPEESNDSLESQPEDAFAEIEWEGEHYKVPAKLKEGFMKNQDYTQKTQQLADKNRELDQLRELTQARVMDNGFQEVIAQETQELSVIDAYLKQVKTIDWSQMTTEQMLRTRHEIDTIKERQQELSQAIAQKKSAFVDQFKAKTAELKAKAKELASKKIQGFSEETEQSVRKFAQTEGLSDFEIDNVLLDPRSYNIVYKAMQFDKVQSGAKPAQEKAEKLLKPSGAGERMPQSTADKLNFNKAMKSAKTSGEKANVIEQRLANVFMRSK